MLMGMMLEQAYIDFRDAVRRNDWLPCGENGEGSLIRSFAGLSFAASFVFAPDYNARHVGALARKYGTEPEFPYFAEVFRQELKKACGPAESPAGL
jgi:hypothetical protein